MTTEIQDHEADDSTSLQHVIFGVGRELFAVAMSPLKEIIRLPRIVQVPLAPPALEGLINLRGQVLPIINLRRVFGFEDQGHDEATRVLVLNVGTPVGFVVDKVHRVLAVHPGQIEKHHGMEVGVDSEYLEGVIKDAQPYDMLMLLDFAKLLHGELAALARAGEAMAATAMAEVGQQEAHEKEATGVIQLVSFSVDSQEYAIPIGHVKEIVQVPEHIIQVPKAQAHLLGIVNLRGHLLPLVSLRQLFGMADSGQLNEHKRIVVTAFELEGERMRVGLVTDSVREVLRVPLDQMEDMPALLRRNKELNEISTVCRLDDGNRLVAVLSVEKMFAHHVILDAVKTAQTMEKELDMTESTVAGDEEQLVVFRILDEEYGVPIAAVKEIVRVPEHLTHVPKAPDFIEGIINLRGTVLPVVDERRRLGLPHMQANERQRIMVFLVGGIRTGFIVDSVTEVLRIARADIKELPDLSHEHGRLIPRVVNLEAQERMILLLDVEQLLETHEVHAITAAMGNS
jgi:purine-binding chemotaxis protein CheW